MIKIITAFIALLLFAEPLMAERSDSSSGSGLQNIIPSGETVYWISLGVGNHLNGSINFNHSLLHSRIIFSQFSQKKELDGGYYSENPNSNERYYKRSVGLSGGVGFAYKSFKWGASAGPSYFWGEVEKIDDINEFESNRYYKNLSTIGLYIGGYLLFTPYRRFGIGSETSLHINKDDISGGIAVTANIGEFGDPTASRRKRADRRQERKERRQELKESPKYEKNAVGIGWSYYLWKRKAMGVVTAWDHPFGIGLFSLGADVSLFFEGTDTTINYISEMGEPNIEVLRISKTTYIPVRFRVGFHPLNLPVFQEKRVKAIAWDPYVVLRVGQEWEWTTATENDVTRKEFGLGEGIFDAGGLWNIDSWGTLGAGVRWHFRPHIGLWGEIDWFRAVAGMSFCF